MTAMPDPGKPMLPNALYVVVRFTLRLALLSVFALLSRQNFFLGLSHLMVTAAGSVAGTEVEP